MTKQTNYKSFDEENLEGKEYEDGDAIMIMGFATRNMLISEKGS